MSDATPGNDQTYFIRNRGRILGPFSIEKLRSLRARGQFSRVHEVSTDRTNWLPGSSLDQLFAATTAVIPARPVYQPTADALMAPAGPPPVAGQSSGSTAAELTLWYYRVNEQQFGPATTAELRNLIASGRLGPPDFVWRDGLMEWSTVEDTVELQSKILAPQGTRPSSSQDEEGRPRRRVWLMLILVLVATLLVAGSVYVGVSGKLGVLLPGAGDVPPNPIPAPAEEPADEPGDADVGRARGGRGIESGATFLVPGHPADKNQGPAIVIQ